MLSHPGVRRVAIGNGQVLRAADADGQEIVIFGRAEGESSVHVWTDAGRPTAYAFRVVPAGAAQRAEVEALLARIPSARSMHVGGSIVIEGDDLSDQDRARIAALAERYPSVLDLTGQVGWDRMVLLDVQVVEIPTSRLREVGLKWDGLTQGGVNVGLAWDGGSTGRLERPGESPVATNGPVSNAAGYFGVNALLSARLALLAQRGEAVMLAQPQLLARSGASATFRWRRIALCVHGCQWQKRHGVQTLWRIAQDHAAHRPQRRDPFTDRSRGEFGGHQPEPAGRTRAAHAPRVHRVQCPIRQHIGHRWLSVARAGRDVSGLPGLLDVPVLGALFASRRYQLRETELAIFVTPRIVSAQDPGLAERARRGRDLLDAAFPDPRVWAPRPWPPTLTRRRGGTLPRPRVPMVGRRCRACAAQPGVMPCWILN